MGTWDTYEARLTVNGVTKREHALKHTQSRITSKIVNSLSCHDVLINGVPQKISIIDKRQDLALKKICALPGETLVHGGLVDFADSKWLITELDANDEVYTRGLMKRCNYLLKWLDETGAIIEKWCIVEDGTKYLIGEKPKEVMTIGDARMAITIGKDADTIKLCRGRRFLLDDPDSPRVLAFQITKPNKLFNNYGGVGAFRFILNEVNVTDDDNTELMIADYYNWTPGVDAATHVNPDTSLSEIVSDAQNPVIDEEVWI